MSITAHWNFIAMIPTSNTPVWDDGAWAPRPRLECRAAADVCVVGLVGSELTCSRELLRRGMRVIRINALPVAGGAERKGPRARVPR